MQKPRKRLVKAKLKEDKLLIFTAKAQRFTADHQKQILYGSGGVILIAVLITLFTLSKAAAERDASFEAFLARDSYARGDLEETLRQTSIIIEDFAGTKSSVEMMMVKARVHEHRGEYDQAEQLYHDVIRKSGDNKYLRFGAYFALGAIEYGRKDFEAAAGYYTDAATKCPKHFQAAVALAEAGRAFKRAGRIEQARHAFKAVLKDYPKSRSAGSIRSDLEEIEFID